MQKIQLFILSTLLLPLFAHAEVQLYGQANISIENYDDGTGEAFRTESNESFVGIKGFYKLRANLTAIYKYEIGVNLTDNQASASDDYLEALDGFVGLQGSYGRIIVGTLETPVRQIRAPFALFKNITLGDLDAISNSSHIRADNIVEYTTPAYDGVIFKYMALPEAGDPDDDSFSSASSTSIIYQSQTSFVAYAKDQDVAGINIDTSRYVISFINPAYTLSYINETTDNGSNEQKNDGYSFSYISGGTKFKYQKLDADNFNHVIGTNAETTAYGIDFILSRNSTLGLYMIDREVSGQPDQKNTGINFIINFE